MPHDPHAGTLSCAWTGCPESLNALIYLSFLFRDGLESSENLNWRRGWDSNPRTPVKMLLEFQSSAFDRSATSPRPAPRPSRQGFITPRPAPNGGAHNTTLGPPRQTDRTKCRIQSFGAGRGCGTT